LIIVPPTILPIFEGNDDQISFCSAFIASTFGEISLTSRTFF